MTGRSAEAEWPGVTVAIPVLNAAADLERCLRAIEAQDYPRGRLEVLVLDGGSSDPTVEVARRHGARVWQATPEYRSGGFRASADARMGLAVELASHEIIAYVMSDNWMPTADWLRQMLRPLVEDATLAGSFTLRYRHRPRAALIERYFALIGVGDPVAFYLNRRDRISWAEAAPRYEGAVVEDCGAHYRVTFDPQALPPLGCNGALVRRSLLERCGLPPERFGHSDAAQRLADMGYASYAVVKNDITHHYRGSFVAELRKRMRFFRVYGAIEREYRLFDGRRPGDWLGLVRCVLYALTVVKPAWDSVQGYRRRRDVAWFVHAPYCFAMTLAYAWSVSRARLGGRGRAASEGALR